MNNTNPVAVIIHEVSPAEISGHSESAPDMKSDVFPEKVAPLLIISSMVVSMPLTKADSITQIKQSSAYYFKTISVSKNPWSPVVSGLGQKGWQAHLLSASLNSQPCLAVIDFTHRAESDVEPSQRPTAS